MISLQHFHEIRKKVNQYNATLVVVTKNQSTENILNIYKEGHRIFGENRVQELLHKKTELAKDIDWHLIGSLQKNKIKSILPNVQLIHSVDSFNLANKINEISKKLSCYTSILLEMKIAQEETKHGFTYDNLIKSLDLDNWISLTHVSIKGLMGMASFTDNQLQIKNEFRSLRFAFEHIGKTYFPSGAFTELSMGMSGDYMIALEEGSTMIRVGSKIFMN